MVARVELRPLRRAGASLSIAARVGDFIARPGRSPSGVITYDGMWRGMRTVLRLSRISDEAVVQVEIVRGPRALSALLALQEYFERSLGRPTQFVEPSSPRRGAPSR